MFNATYELYKNYTIFSTANRLLEVKLTMEKILMEDNN